MNELKIACIQMMVSDDKNTNIIQAENLVKKSLRKDNEIELVILPEMFNCPYKTDLFPQYAEEEKGYTFSELSRIAQENNIFLVGGSIPEKNDDKVYNTCYIYNNRGELIGKHRKIHLFDIDIEDGQKFKESDTLSAGNNLCIIETPFATIGIIICYDLRFPELSRLLVDKGADIIVVPGAFNMTTGPAHWEILFRTRALDNQVYMIGAAPARDENSDYISYGNSIVTDPWGKVINRLGKDEDILFASLDLKMINKIRNELPLLKHRRMDIYNKFN
ncbi:MAG: carbon-nitrogen hydrolase family protein [Bacillota bacterium]